MADLIATGFYGNDFDTCYVTPSGRIWVVASVDELPNVFELFAMLDGATSLDGMVTPEEAINWVKQVEAASGETILESA